MNWKEYQGGKVAFTEYGTLYVRPHATEASAFVVFGCRMVRPAIITDAKNIDEAVQVAEVLFQSET